MSDRMTLARMNQRRNSLVVVPRGKGGALEIAALRAAARRGAGDVSYPGTYTSGSAVPDTATSSGGGAGTGGSMQGATSLPAPNTSVYNATSVIVTGTPGVNLRSAASPTASILASPLTGTTLSVIGPQQNGWLNVQTPDGIVGWVYSAYVRDASVAPDLSSAAPAASSETAVASDASSSPSILGGQSGSGLLLIAVVGGIVWAAYKLL